jgi:MYXO-CTERM domain-containing protein
MRSMRSVRSWPLIAVALAGCSASEGGEALGRAEQAILDGEFAGQSSIEGTVAIVDFVTGGAYCTGTLVAADVVVTAAHCGLTIDSETGRITGTRPVSNMLVIAGVTSVDTARAEDTFEVVDVQMHPAYGIESVDEDSLTGSLNDIAILALARPVTSVAPVPVLSPDRARQFLEPGLELSIAGFGASDRSGRFGSGTLRHAEVPLVRVGEQEFIAGYEGTSDACPGDSGGPVYVESDDTVALVGVTSRGLANATSACGGGGIYTLAPSYLDYLLEMSPSPILVLGTLRSGEGEGTDDGEDDGADVADGTDAPLQPTGEVRAGVCSASPLPAAAGPSAIAMALGLFALALRRRRH